MYGGDLSVCIQEEATRGSIISDNPSWIPIMSQTLKPVFVEEENEEFRADVGIREQSEIIRIAQSCSGNVTAKVYPEGGGNKKGLALFLKYLFGDVNTTQIGSSAAYYHGFKKSRDPFDDTCGTIGDKGISVHLNRPTVCSTKEDFPFSGMRVSNVTLTQEVNKSLQMSADIFGQKALARAAEVGGETYSTVGVFKSGHLTINDAVTPIGVAPDYTGFTPTGNTIRLRSLNMALPNGLADAFVLGTGHDYPDETDIGMITGTVTLSALAKDPATGFSSIDTFEKWINDVDIELFFQWDNGELIAGASNYMLQIHMPKLHIIDSNIDDVLQGENMFTMTARALVATTETYATGIFLQNSCPSI